MAARNTIKTELLNELLEGRDPKTVFESEGLLDELVADDAVFVSPLGNVRTKSGLLASLKSGELKVASFDTHEFQVKLHEDTAVAGVPLCDAAPAVPAPPALNRRPPAAERHGYTRFARTGCI